MLIQDVLFFLVCAVIIFIAGKKLSYYGNLIALRTGIGRAWIGLVLLASVTSLPELIVGISAASIVQSADLAIGDVVGSCAFNLLLLSLLDFVSPRPILGRASNTHILAASFGVILLSVVGIGLFMPKDISIAGWLSAVSLIAFCIYFMAVRTLYKYDKNHGKEEEESIVAVDISFSLRRTMFHYGLNAGVIIVAALLLPRFAEKIAIDSGMGLTFVGTLFLAATTSLPEIAVSRSALLAGNTDLAIGNILGSNIFNIFILAVDDAFYVKGSLLFHAADINLISVFSVIIMSAVVIAGLMTKPQQKWLLLTWDTFFILVIFIINLTLLYWLRS